MLCADRFQFAIRQLATFEAVMLYIVAREVLQRGVKRHSDQSADARPACQQKRDNECDQRADAVPDIGMRPLRAWRFRAGAHCVFCAQARHERSKPSARPEAIDALAKTRCVRVTQAADPGVMHFGMGRSMMAKENRTIDRDTKPVQPARPAVDQLMRIGIADLPKVLTEKNKTGEAFPDIEACLTAERKNGDDNQDQMGEAQKNAKRGACGELFMRVFVRRGVFNQPVHDEDKSRQVEHSHNGPNPAQKPGEGQQKHRHSGGQSEPKHRYDSIRTRVLIGVSPLT